MADQQGFLVDHLGKVARVIIARIARSRLGRAAMAALIDAHDAKARGEQPGHRLEHVRVRRDAMQAQGGGSRSRTSF
jgi:hypothetical protein